MIEVTGFRNESVAVLGLARSGLAAAQALQRGGARVLAWDDAQKRRVEAQQAGLELTDLAEADLKGVRALVLSPGIPHSFPAPHTVAARAKEAGIPIIGDIELLAVSQLEARYLGITGTNGKSTTTALIGHILKEAGRRVAVGGNIGVPALALEALGADGTYVLEMSSYQLELTPEPRLRRAPCCSTSRPTISTGTAAWRDISPPRSASSRARPSGTSPSSASTMRSAAASPASSGASASFRSRPRARRRAASQHPRAGSSTTWIAGSAAFSICAGSSGCPGGTIGRTRRQPSPPCARSALPPRKRPPASAALPASPTARSRSQSSTACATSTIRRRRMPMPPGTRSPATTTFYWIAGGQAKEGGIASLGVHFAAHPPGLSHRRRGSRVRGDARRRGALRAERHARARAACGARGGAARRDRAAVAGLRLVRPVQRFRGARRSVPASGRSLGRSARMNFARTDQSVIAQWWWTVDRWTLLALAMLIGFGSLMVMAASPAVAVRIGADSLHFVHRYLRLAAGDAFDDVRRVAAKPARHPSHRRDRVRRLARGSGLYARQRRRDQGRAALDRTARPFDPAFGIRQAELRRGIGVAVRAIPAQSRLPRPLDRDGALCARDRAPHPQPDLGMAVVVTAVWFAQFFLAGLRLYWVGGRARLRARQGLSAPISPCRTWPAASTASSIRQAATATRSTARWRHSAMADCGAAGPARAR